MAPNPRTKTKATAKRNKREKEGEQEGEQEDEQEGEQEQEQEEKHAGQRRGFIKDPHNKKAARIQKLKASSPATATLGTATLGTATLGTATLGTAARSDAEELARLAAAFAKDGIVSVNTGCQSAPLTLAAAQQQLAVMYVECDGRLNAVLAHALLNIGNRLRPVQQRPKQINSGSRHAFLWTCTACGSSHVNRADVFWVPKDSDELCVKVSRAFFTELENRRQHNELGRLGRWCSALCTPCATVAAKRAKSVLGSYLVRSVCVGSTLFATGSPLRLPEVSAECVKEMESAIAGADSRSIA
jgi:hypothetical protein